MGESLGENLRRGGGGPLKLKIWSSFEVCIFMGISAPCIYNLLLSGGEEL